MEIQKVIEQDTKSFYGKDIPVALEVCLSKGYRSMFMPELIDVRIDKDKSHEVWRNRYTTVSAIVTGFGKDGKKKVVYAHCDNFLCNPENIREAINHPDFRKNNRGAVFPKEEFYRLVRMEDNKSVFVVDYDKLRKFDNGEIYVRDALRHPMVIPFIGGEERARQYLEKHEEVCGKKIGVRHTGDFRDEPIGRLAFLDYFYYYNHTHLYYNYSNIGCYNYANLLGHYPLNYGGCFIGLNVPKKELKQT
ncbi:MAG: hypothetical protein ABIB71_04890 [Candidatus Woesearchaeota archaeon]